MTVIDVASVFGGHAVVSEGGLSLSGTPLQRSLGITDSPDQMFRDIVALGFVKNLTIDGDPELFQKYEMFVDTILNASEDILHGQPTLEWFAAVRMQLNLHRDYLLSPHFQNSGYLEQYTPKFRAFMADVLSQKPKP